MDKAKIAHEQDHVLLVGNFDLEDPQHRDSFGLRAWKEVWGEYIGSASRPPGNSRPTDTDPLGSIKDHWQINSSESRHKLREPIVLDPVTSYEPPKPIPLSDQLWRTEIPFEDILYWFLSNTNCLAIISASPAEYTCMLLEALDPIRIPVLISVATAVEILAEEDKALTKFRYVLRLIPNNALQAQALRAKVDSIVPESGRPVSERVVLYHGNITDSYVRDLKNAVLGLIRIDEDKIFSDAKTLTDRLDKDKEMVIVAIGYKDTLEPLLNCLANPNDKPKHFRLLQSDGVSYDEFTQILKRLHSWGDKAEFLLCRPAHDHSTYARWSYLAVAKEAEQRWRDVADGVRIEQRLEPPVFRIRDILEKDKLTFSFAGNENQAGGYYIFPVSPTGTTNELAEP